jgi:hypothetical protein
MDTRCDPASKALNTCSGCSRPVHGTVMCLARQGQLKFGTTGLDRPAEVNFLPGRVQLAHKNTVISVESGKISTYSSHQMNSLRHGFGIFYFQRGHDAGFIQNVFFALQNVIPGIRKAASECVHAVDAQTHSSYRIRICLRLHGYLPACC